LSAFVYIWYDRKYKRYYLGSHVGSEDDGYISSSKWMKNAYKKRPMDFKRRIIERTSSKNILHFEQRWLDMINETELGTRYYNLKLLAAGGNGGAKKGRKYPNGFSTTQGMKKPKSKTHRQNISNSLKGVKKSFDHVSKTRRTCKWLVTTPEDKTFSVTNLAEWCKERGLWASNLKKQKNWTLINLGRQE